MWRRHYSAPWIWTKSAPSECRSRTTPKASERTTTRHRSQPVSRIEKLQRDFSETQSHKILVARYRSEYFRLNTFSYVNTSSTRYVLWVTIKYLIMQLLISNFDHTNFSNILNYKACTRSIGIRATNIMLLYFIKSLRRISFQFILSLISLTVCKWF